MEGLFKIPKLKGSSNYDIWAIRIESILIKEGLNNFINIKPEDLNSKNYPNNEELKLFKDNSNKALSIIRLSIEDGPLLLLKNVKDPYNL